jgi:hypothetical protein
MPKAPAMPVALKKYGFWIILAVMILLMFIFWLMATLGLAGEFAKKITDIKKYKDLPPTIAAPTNEKGIEKLALGVGTTDKDVRAVWKEVYDRQNTVLIWPNIKRDMTGKVIAQGLSDDFVRAVVKLPPPERLGGKGMDPAQNTDTQFWITNSQRFKQEYRAFGKTQIEALCAKLKTKYRIGARESAKADAAEEGAEDAAAAAGEWVIWAQKSQQEALEHLLFPEGRDPPTQAILYAQEDLWVYQAIADAVTKTNQAAGALGNYNAAIKRIHDVQIGEQREATVGKEIYRMGGGKAREKAAPAAESEEEGDEEKAVVIPSHLVTAGKRYVDAAGNPLKGQLLLDLGDKAEFKRMPIYMKIDMDQRWLGRFLAECANSPLTIETTQLTCAVEPPAEAGSGETEERSSTSSNTPGTKKDAKNAYDLTLELAGIVYIYFPPPTDAAPAEGEEEPKEEVAAR